MRNNALGLDGRNQNGFRQQSFTDAGGDATYNGVKRAELDPAEAELH